METAKPPLRWRTTATAAAFFFFFFIRLLARACLSLGPDVSLCLPLTFSLLNLSSPVG